MDTQITEQARNSLLARRGTWHQIAKQTGVSYSWISKFMNGHIPNPGTATLYRLMNGMEDARPELKEAEHV